ncbi:hypothetical protein GFS31_24120 [Leptolyngbya sp. BL0902]|nr:hypothetical protein GFS31_24120 [Leptolyngbya sp. BL0902]
MGIFDAAPLPAQAAIPSLARYGCPYPPVSVDRKVPAALTLNPSSPWEMG